MQLKRNFVFVLALLPFSGSALAQLADSNIVNSAPVTASGVGAAPAMILGCENPEAAAAHAHSDYWTLKNGCNPPSNRSTCDALRNIVQSYYENWGRCERTRMIKNAAKDTAMGRIAINDTRLGRLTCINEAQAFSFDVDGSGNFQLRNGPGGTPNTLAYQCYTHTRIVDGQKVYPLATFYLQVSPDCLNNNWISEHFNQEVFRTTTLGTNAFIDKLNNTSACSIANKGLISLTGSYTPVLKSENEFQTFVTSRNLSKLAEAVAKENVSVSGASRSRSKTDYQGDDNNGGSHHLEESTGAGAQIDAPKTDRVPAATEKPEATRVRNFEMKL